MIREERVVRLRFDAARNELTLECEGDLSGAATKPGGAVTAQLLLDRAGFLVGVDIGTEPNRTVAMLGRHEDVDRTASGRVILEGRTVRVLDAKGARGHEPNPYVR
jgi:hypothetical protein